MESEAVSGLPEVGEETLEEAPEELEDAEEVVRRSRSGGSGGCFLCGEERDFLPHVAVCFCHTFLFKS